MPFPEARRGNAGEIVLYPNVSEEITLGDPEKAICSSIKQLCALDVAEDELYKAHKIRNRHLLEAAAKNVKLYIQQAFEFYEAAASAKPSTAPLLYYYCFLNLAKARCEMLHPKFHQKDESYRHGISWKPNRKYIVNMEKDVVSLTNRGIWHVLWEAVTGRSCRVPSPLPLEIKHPFSMCKEVSIEYSRTYGGEPRQIDLVEPQIVIDSDRGETWIRFSVCRSDLRIRRISRPRFLGLITRPGSPYHQVQSDKPDTWMFELENPKSFGQETIGHRVLRDEIRALNLFVHPGSDEEKYYVPIQIGLPLSIPQLMVLYTLVFWLGSLVRYDPHSVGELQDSRHWILIDGFLNQSRILLLELFEWEFYQTETLLQSAR
jgi:hypothetical protein